MISESSVERQLQHAQCFNTRSVEAISLVALQTWDVPFWSPALSRCGKGQRCSRHVNSDQILEFRGQGGRKHTNRAQFLELCGFIETMGAYWSRVHACRYHLWFANHLQSVPISSCGKATSTRAVLKQNLSIKSTNQSLLGGPSNLKYSILESWSVSRCGKGQGCLRHVVTKFWSLEGKEAGKHMNRAQLLELSDFIHIDRQTPPSDFQIIPNPSHFQAVV